MWYTTIKKYYNDGLYTDANLATFVKASMLTQTEMDEIIASKPKAA